MATIRKRVLPSGRIAWLVDFKDTNGKRRAKQFTTRRGADAFLVKARAQVATGVYVHDADSVTVAEAALQWLNSCARRATQAAAWKRRLGLAMKLTCGSISARLILGLAV